MPRLDSATLACHVMHRLGKSLEELRQHDSYVFIEAQIREIAQGINYSFYTSEDEIHRLAADVIHRLAADDKLCVLIRRESHTPKANLNSDPGFDVSPPPPVPWSAVPESIAKMRADAAASRPDEEQCRCPCEKRWNHYRPSRDLVLYKSGSNSRRQRQGRSRSPQRRRDVQRLRSPLDDRAARRSINAKTELLESERGVAHTRETAHDSSSGRLTPVSQSRTPV